MRKKLFFSLLLFFMGSSLLFSQTLTIKGKVTDEAGNPLPNAIIAFVIGFTTGKSELFPLPQTARDANPNLQPQNFGY